MSDTETEVKPTTVLPPPEEGIREASWEDVQGADPDQLMVNAGDGIESIGMDERPKPTGQKIKLKMGYYRPEENNGSDALQIAIESADIEQFVSADLEEMIKWQPNILIVSQPVKFLSNGQIDDADLIADFQKLSYEVPCGICLRTPITIETFKRIGEACGLGWVDKKFVYMPDLQESTTEILRAPRLMLGGSETSCRSFLDILRTHSVFSMKEVFVDTPQTIIAFKMAISGFQAVKQTFFDQLFDYVMEDKEVNPHTLRRILADSPEMTDPINTIPLKIRSKLDGLTKKEQRNLSGEYNNRDVRLLMSVTDKIPLIEECVNPKNFE